MKYEKRTVYNHDQYLFKLRGFNIMVFVDHYKNEHEHHSASVHAEGFKGRCMTELSITEEFMRYTGDYWLESLAESAIYHYFKIPHAYDKLRK